MLNETGEYHGFAPDAPPPGGPLGRRPRAHAVQFYQAESFLDRAVAGFLGEGLRAGDAAVVVASERRRAAVSALLAEGGIDLERACRRGQVAWLEVRATLSRFMAGGVPDPERFLISVGRAVEQALRTGAEGRVRAYGEMVDVLFRDGQAEAALRLERLWNELATRHPFSLLCAYAIGSFQKETDAAVLDEVTRLHSHCFPAEGYAALAADGARAREIIRLQQQATALETELALRKALERDLRETLAERERAEKELVQAREEAERASAAKSQFLAVMSHELRTPLNAIVGFARLLHEEVGGTLSPVQHGFLDRIDGAAAHLLDLIDRVLRLGRIEAGREEVAPEDVDVRELVADVVALMEPTAAGKGLELALDAPAAAVRCCTDPAELRQILLNLLSNAVKFTNAGRVDVALRQEGDDVVLAVRDTGIGIDAPDLERVFERFVQLEGTSTRRFEGAGLGLAVSRELARLLGGELTARSTPGQGSVFVLRLPTLRLPTAPPAARAEPTAA